MAEHRGSRYYFLYRYGYALTGFNQISGKLYYFYDSGKLATNT